MTVETAGFVSELNSSNPPGTDVKSQGDDHLRLIKTALKATFPNASKAFYFPSIPAEATGNVTVSAPTDGGKIMPVSALAAARTVTLPTTGLYDGFQLTIVKSDYSLNLITIDGNSKTINGKSSEVLSKGYQKALITYSTELAAWIAQIDSVVPVGSFIFNGDPTAPPGYVIASGVGSIGSATSGATVAGAHLRALFCHCWDRYSNTVAPVSGGRGANAAADFEANKQLTMPDLRGRAIIGVDTMESSAAGRVTEAKSGIAATAAGATGGSETHQLTEDELPVIEPEVNEDPHDHRYGRTSGNVGRSGSDSLCRQGTSNADTDPAVTGLTITPFGGDEEHQNMPPSFTAYVFMAM